MAAWHKPAKPKLICPLDHRIETHGQNVDPEALDSPFVVDTTQYWYKKPLRILQNVLREPDGKDYEAESVIKYMKQTHANVLVENAGGIIDFF